MEERYMKQKWQKTASLALSAAMATGMLAGLIPGRSFCRTGGRREDSGGVLCLAGGGATRTMVLTGTRSLHWKAARDAVRKINDDMTGDIYVFIDGGKLLR